jgi:subtilisin family serine protease
MAISSVHGARELGLTVAGAGPNSLTTLISEALPSMDPRLQRALVMRRNGAQEFISSSGGVDEIAVIAKVTDVAAWESLSEVRVGSTISLGTDGDSSKPSIVTARVAVTRLDFVRQQPFVVSLKAPRPVVPALDATTQETGARPNLLPAGNATDGGEGVVVGIVDFGCDFAHRNLMKSGKTRVETIWDQGGQHTPGSGVPYGRLIERAAINAALSASDPYASLGYGPDPDRPGVPPGSHGTHVADIAAGNGKGSGVAGVAPKAAVIFVELAADDVPWMGSQVVGKSFGDSVQLLEAVRFIFDRAGSRPCVVNLSLGTNGGPHDGTTLVEEGFDRMVREADNRAIVIAASNSFSDGIHAAGRVPAGGQFDLRWRVPVADVTGNEIEIWYPGPDRFTCDLVAPNGDVVVTVAPGDNQAMALGNQVVVFASSRLDDPNNHDNMIGIFLERDLPAGDWTIRLRGDTVQDGRFHAWIERDDRRPSTFLEPLDNSHTLGSISTGHETIVVGSYDAHKTQLPLSFFSSAGPTRDGRHKPEVSAPGHAVLAAHSRTRTGVVSKSGTSMAAPSVTGIVALVLAQARAQGVRLTSRDIRQAVIQTARRNPPPGVGWDSRYGFGRISASAAVATVMQGGAAPTTARTRAAGASTRGGGSSRGGSARAASRTRGR